MAEVDTWLTLFGSLYYRQTQQIHLASWQTTMLLHTTFSFATNQTVNIHN